MKSKERLNKKMEKGRKILQDTFNKKDNLNLRQLKSHLKLYGYKPIRGSYGAAFTDGEIVIKSGMLSVNYIPKSKYVVPTILLNNDYYTFLIQPLCETKNKLDAYLILSKNKSFKDKDLDIHQWNCGWFNGQAVIFDW